MPKVEIEGQTVMDRLLQSKGFESIVNYRVSQVRQKLNKLCEEKESWDGERDLSYILSYAPPRKLGKEGDFGDIRNFILRAYDNTATRGLRDEELKLLEDLLFEKESKFFRVFGMKQAQGLRQLLNTEVLKRYPADFWEAEFYKCKQEQLMKKERMEILNAEYRRQLGEYLKTLTEEQRDRFNRNRLEVYHKGKDENGNYQFYFNDMGEPEPEQIDWNKAAWESGYGGRKKRSRKHHKKSHHRKTKAAKNGGKSRRYHKKSHRKTHRKH